MNRMTEDTQLDLDAYLARIGYAGPRVPTLSVLRDLHAAHPASIPFENIDSLMGIVPALDIASLGAKMVAERRGGYCYEQNILFAAALEAIGFEVTRFGSRVRWMRPPELPEGSRTHMVLRVEVPNEGTYLADVGGGGYTLTTPLRLEPGAEQDAGGWNTVRLQQESDGRLTLQVELAGRWRDVHRFSMEPQLPIDYVVANWYTATHPKSMFRTNLLVERVLSDARYTLFNRKLTVRKRDGNVSERLIGSEDELGEVLDLTLAITPPVSPALIWERLPAS